MQLVLGVQRNVVKTAGCVNTDKLSIEYKVGGLAPDSDEPMPLDMQQFLQQTWHRIEQQLGTKFNHDFWHTAQPRRSTYPACRAVLVAKAT